MKLEIQPLAENDIEEIYIYSFNQFGKKKAREYAKHLQEQIESLLDNPLRGTDYSFIDNGLRCLVVASHSVFYEVVEDAVTVIRVLHQSRDVRRFF